MTEWDRSDEIDAETLDAYAEEERGRDAQLHVTCAGYKKVRAIPSPDARTACVLMGGTSTLASRRGKTKARVLERRAVVEAKAKANTKATDPVP